MAFFSKDNTVPTQLAIQKPRTIDAGNFISLHKHWGYEICFRNNGTRNVNECAFLELVTRETYKTRNSCNKITLSFS